MEKDEKGCAEDRRRRRKTQKRRMGVTIGETLGTSEVYKSVEETEEVVKFIIRPDETFGEEAEITKADFEGEDFEKGITVASGIIKGTDGDVDRPAVAYYEFSKAEEWDLEMATDWVKNNAE